MDGSIFGEGAELICDLVDEAREMEILEAIMSAEWRKDLGRRVQHYGYRYDYASKGNGGPAPAPPFPDWARRMAFELKHTFGGVEPEQCIVNEYVPGQGIGMHADHASFGPVVASVSLGDEWEMRFRRRHVRPYQRDGMPGDERVPLPRRSALILRGRARTAWMHGICRNDSRTRRRTRVSATFRTLAR